MTHSDSNLDKAVKMLASSTGVATPEVAAQRAQAYILMALVERIDALIEAVRESRPSPLGLPPWLSASPVTGVAEAALGTEPHD